MNTTCPAFSISESHDNGFRQRVGIKYVSLEALFWKLRVSDQGRLVYGTVELQHPQSLLHLINDILYR